MCSGMPVWATDGALDGGVACSDGDVELGGDRGAARMETVTQVIPYSVKDGHGSLVVWIGGGGEELVAGWLWSGESARVRAAERCSSPAIRGARGADTGGGGN